MRKIVRLDLLSAVRLFALFYAVIGLIVSLKSILTGEGSVYCPLGFHYPWLNLDVHLDVTPPNPPSVFTAFTVLIAVIFYAITGAISGGTATILYNLASRFWPGVSAEVEAGAETPKSEPVPQPIAEP